MIAFAAVVLSLAALGLQAQGLDTEDESTVAVPSNTAELDRLREEVIERLRAEELERLREEVIERLREEESQRLREAELERLREEEERERLREEDHRRFWNELTPDLHERMEAHSEITGEGFIAAPPFINDILGVDFALTRGLPITVFQHVLDASPEAPSAAMIESFNIQLQSSPDHPLDLPPTAMLHTSLTHAGDRESVDVRLRLDGDAYYVAYPTQFQSDNRNALAALYEVAQIAGKAQRMFGFELDGLSGITFDDSTVTDMPPMGTHVTVNIRYGDVRVDTMFQWVGLPPEFPKRDTVGAADRTFLR